MWQKKKQWRVKSPTRVSKDIAHRRSINCLIQRRFAHSFSLLSFTSLSFSLNCILEFVNCISTKCTWDRISNKIIYIFIYFSHILLKVIYIHFYTTHLRSTNKLNQIKHLNPKLFFSWLRLINDINNIYISKIVIISFDIRYNWNLYQVISSLFWINTKTT